MKLIELKESNDLELNKLLAGDYSQAWNFYVKNDLCYWRGISDDDNAKYRIQDPHARAKPRTHKGYIDNKWFFDTLREVSPEWKNAPNRSTSVFMSSNHGHAGFFNHGVAHVALLKNDSKLVTCEVDWNHHSWDAGLFFKMHGGLGMDFKEGLRIFLTLLTGTSLSYRAVFSDRFLDDGPGPITMTSIIKGLAYWKKHQDQIDKAQEEAVKMDKHLYANRVNHFERIIKHADIVVDELRDAVSFKNNDFQLCNTKQALNILKDAKEIKEAWTESSILLLDLDFARDKKKEQHE